MQGPGASVEPELDTSPVALRRAAVGGVLWTVAQKWGVRIVAFLVYVFLGRLLEPPDFGTVAVAAAFGAWAGLLVDFGLPIFIIQAERLTAGIRDTVFWIGMAFAATMATVQMAAAGIIADWFGSPDIADVLRVLAVVFPLASIAGIQGAMFKRQLRFKAVALRGMIAVLASGIVAVTMAFAGFGVWALVGQIITFQLASVVALWVADPWRPRLDWQPRVAREALVFGAKSLGSFTLSNLNGTADVLVIGHRLGATAVGNYSMAIRLIRVVLDSLVSVVYSVANPLFARAKSDQRLLGAAYSRTVTQAILVSYPALAILAAAFGPVLEFVVGPKWLGAATVGSLITLAEAVSVPIWFDRSLMYALGRPGAELALNLVDGALLLVCVVAGSQWGIVGVAVGLCIRALMMWPLRLLVSCRLAGLRPGPLMVRELRIWLAAGVAWASASAVVQATGDLPPVASVVLAGVVGLGGYLIAISVIARSEAAYTLSTIRGIIAGRRRRASTG